ncbi:MAG: hypothetical protein JSU63_05640 [Phycisphaerales bacterium]|nr:MAG: hypothetical protein JSU63_05640 [Phycisphaerales bacterium]
MSGNTNEEKLESASETPKAEEKPAVDWADPTIPVGDSPPLPRWPAIVLGVAWFGWLVFLAFMAVSMGNPAAV